MQDGTFGWPVRLRLLGSYNVANALAAACAASGLGIGPSVIRAGLERLPRVPGRFERVPLSGARFTAVVDYAHTPDALARALGAARSLKPGRILTVFGCGGNRDRGKRPRMGEIATRLSDRVWITSDNPRFEEPGAIIREILAGVRRTGVHEVEPDRRTAIRRAMAAARPGDLVLVAGKGHERDQIIGARRLPFDDARVAASAWREAMA
jgi:UDP-N-acetylmuramoyl-L-alanyl-D-glutamate--2,6-diaminopimelate ligase